MVIGKTGEYLKDYKKEIEKMFVLNQFYHKNFKEIEKKILNKKFSYNSF